MIIKDINNLKAKLENQILKDEKYEKIYKTSVEIDELLIKYYKECDVAK